jgi:hypothetical protein
MMSAVVMMLAGQARFLKRTLGTRCAAGFLRNRGATIQEAMLILAGTCIVRGGL